LEPEDKRPSQRELARLLQVTRQYVAKVAKRQMLRPFDASLMRRYPASARVNSVKNDNAECAEEIRAVAAGA
jgi:hypothetical protein